MQTFVNFRSSQYGLQEYLEKFTEKGWKVLSVTKGSELTRIIFSLKWTAILENDAEDADPYQAAHIAADITSESYKNNLMAFVGFLLGAAVVSLFIVLPIILNMPRH